MYISDLRPCDAFTTHPLGELYISYRLIWVLVLLTAFSVFIAIIATNIVRLRGYPKTVNMDMQYKRRLPFPAVTICNHNMFR